MKTIRVVAAVIRKGNHIFAAARGYGDYRGQWEFPGGKIEPGETPQEALRREIMEELAIPIRVGERIDTVSYDYPAFHLDMDCFWCEQLSGQIVLKEAQEARWLSMEELETVPWLPADRILLPKVKAFLQDIALLCKDEKTDKL